MAVELKHDPYNLIITGVGGQGNVLASRMLGAVLTAQGLWVTIGETFGASQRGGSVMSHLRVSQDGSWSPQIPQGRAHMVLALEPLEALRVLETYGNPQSMAIVNDRPVMPYAAIAGHAEYPAAEEVAKWLGELTAQTWIIPATETALELGLPIYANVIMMGALAAVGDLPISREGFEAELIKSLGPAKMARNLDAFDQGAAMIAS
ncbi:MAG: indolepyruvate oxidoreductase subunit beta [Desulfarculaceae bacterium]|nr:indolepyruvate oxidoreductase subunit beta [Desulfarculaceae bacterium]MCF8071669.1 indolepyruvate oxidoreductase subunit beta [Desulfarculaceae bacterium]MCF8102484.1 indolepyruvate oxidoreductase subunit beta [Desulfarculaceae bacterium]MCF8114948.1 indolepyruvate oxidoreductase subunit beta [Desulfarculaceae bacterium]